VFYESANLDKQPDIILKGLDWKSSFGYSLSPIGDLNKDGFDDILVGAPTGGPEKAGQVMIFYGGDPMDSIPDIILNGENTDDFFGGSLASSFREDRKGPPDFIIGASANDEGGESIGKVYVYEGKIPFSTTPVNVWTGEAEGDHFGFELTAGYGVGGEDIWYWVIGAPYNDEGGEDAGKIYIYPSASATAAISGTINYRGTTIGLPSASITISGQQIHEANTDSFGVYQSPAIFRNQDYVITPSIESNRDITNAAIKIYDAALVAQHVSEIHNLEDHAFLAANADKDSSITMYDAALIAQYAIEIPMAEGSHAGEWIFDPSFREYTLLTSHEPQDFSAILIGDVNGDWKPKFYTPKVHFVQDPDFISASINEKGFLEVSFNKTTDNDLIAIDASIEFDPSTLKLIQVNKTTVTEKFHSVEKKEEGLYRIGLYSPVPAAGNGKVLIYQFEVLQKEIETTGIKITKYIENSNDSGLLNIGDSISLVKN